MDTKLNLKLNKALELILNNLNKLTDTQLGSLACKAESELIDRDLSEMFDEDEDCIDDIFGNGVVHNKF